MLLNPRHLIDRLREVLPDGSLPHKRSVAAGRQTVIAAPALAGLLDPAAFDQPFSFQSVKRRIKRGDVKGDRPGGAFFNLFPDVVSVALTIFEQCEDE